MRVQDRMRQAFIEKGRAWEAYGDPTELGAELEIQRTLLYLFLSRVAKEQDLGIEINQDTFLLGPGEEVSIEDIRGLDLGLEEVITIVYAMIKEITKVAGTITHQKKEAALSMAEVKYMRAMLEDTFERYITDEDTRRQAVEYFAKRVGS